MTGPQKNIPSKHRSPQVRYSPGFPRDPGDPSGSDGIRPYLPTLQITATPPLLGSNISAQELPADLDGEFGCRGKKKKHQFPKRELFGREVL